MGTSLTTGEIKKIIMLAKTTPDEINAIENLNERKKKMNEVLAARIKMQTIDPEDLEIMAENLEAREMLCKQGAKNLYYAICNQAVHDYKQATKKIPNCKTKKELNATLNMQESAKDFFGSKFFQNITKTSDKDAVIEAVHKQMKREAMEKLNLSRA